MQIQQMPIEALIPYIRNPRRNDEQVDRMCSAIREFGFRIPVVAKSDGSVVDGHLRLKAAIKLGMTEVPVALADELTDAQVKAFRLLANKSANWAEWDDELLKLEMDELADMGYDLELTGFDQDEIDALEVDVEELPPGPADDEIPEPPVDPVTKPGDVWILGNHRILCGDCRNFDDVTKLLDGKRINVAVTSPPYASQREYDPSSGFKPIHPDEFSTWYSDVAANIMANLAEDGSYFMNIKPHCDDGERHLYVMDLVLAHRRDWGWKYIDELIWRRPGIPGDHGLRFRNDFEPIFHFTKSTRTKEVKFHPLEVGHESDGVAVYSKSNKNVNTNGNVHLDAELTTGIARPSNVLEFGRNSENIGHAAMFPVALPSFFIKAYSDKGDVIFDPFMGGGTTLIAAEQEGRVACGTEISPRFCDVIVRRWEKLTGKQAKLEATGQTFAELDGGH